MMTADLSDWRLAIEIVDSRLTLKYDVSENRRARPFRRHVFYPC